jgi:hypothetical protein
MNLDGMTIEQLEALCYRQIVILNQTQQNINIIQAELAKRQNAGNSPDSGNSGQES